VKESKSTKDNMNDKGDINIGEERDYYFLLKLGDLVVYIVRR
jgi:hypothetical protein